MQSYNFAQIYKLFQQLQPSEIHNLIKTFITRTYLLNKMELTQRWVISPHRLGEIKMEGGRSVFRHFPLHHSHEGLPAVLQTLHKRLFDLKRAMGKSGPPLCGPTFSLSAQSQADIWARASSNLSRKWKTRNLSLKNTPLLCQHPIHIQAYAYSLTRLAYNYFFALVPEYLSLLENVLSMRGQGRGVGDVLVVLGDLAAKNYARALIHLAKTKLPTIPTSNYRYFHL